ncbi:MAG: hypothetical protein QOI10_294 [Solirubrobacterales bacterium]|nr:hypothetical protein [Solirubrobacterales bacterium]
MLPGLLLVGLAAGLIARRTPLWLPIAMGVVWAVVIAADISTESGTLAMAAVLGVANTSVGLVVGRAIRGAEGIART